MRDDLSPFGFETGLSRFTHLFVCISEEADGYTVQARLYDPRRPKHVAWGEETADSFEAASGLIASLAAEFSIPQTQIKIEIRMDVIKNGTLH